MMVIPLVFACISLCLNLTTLTFFFFWLLTQCSSSEHWPWLQESRSSRRSFELLLLHRTFSLLQRWWQSESRTWGTWLSVREPTNRRRKSVPQFYLSLTTTTGSGGKCACLPCRGAKGWYLVAIYQMLQKISSEDTFLLLIIYKCM